MPSAQHLTCAFCVIEQERIVLQNEHAFTVRDLYPVSPGHTLVVPRSHLTDWWVISRAERDAVWEMVDATRRRLAEELRPDGYNVGFNAGRASGQTIDHVHVHVIPRYHGDVPDPTGGVRGVIPGRARYPLAPVSAVEVAVGEALDGAELIERLLALIAEGQRSATYKPALLLALVELACERADGPTALTLPLTEVADRVIARYWPQTRPHPDAPSGTLRQSTTRSSRIIDALLELRRSSGALTGGSLVRVRAMYPDHYARARKRVAAALARQPIPRLQRPGDLRSGESYPRFLYDDSRYIPERGALDAEPVIVLLPGVAEAMARSAPVLRQTGQRIWQDEVARINRIDVDDQRLHDFLFGVERVNLTAVATRLRHHGVDRCFWCEQPLGHSIDVDHVIPWSRHPTDDLANLVLSDSSCNNDKRDRLVAGPLIRRWIARDLGAVAAVAGDLQWPFDLARTRAVARSSYRHLPAGLPLWAGRRETVLFDEQERAGILAAFESVA